MKVAMMGMTLATMSAGLSIAQQQKQDKDVHDTPLSIIEAKGRGMQSYGCLKNVKVRKIDCTCSD